MVEEHIESMYAMFDTGDLDTSENKVCKNCNSTIFSHTTEGDSVCSECGFVCESGVIDDGPEWTNYNCEHNERCEYNNNAFFHTDNMSTQIGYKRNMKQSDWILMKWQRTFQMASKDRSLLKVYNRIENQCTLHNINQIVINNAKMLYKFVSVLKLSRGAVREAMLASCVFYSFIDNGSPRNIEEVANIFDADSKKVNKTNKMLASYLWHSDRKPLLLKTVSCDQIIHRYCDKIDIHPINTASIVKLASSYEDKHEMIGKDASYVAALAIYNYPIIHKLTISKDDICNNCFLSTVTLNKLLKLGI